jgi:hypothetical protein
MGYINISQEILEVISGNGRRCVAVLWAYLDESETHKGSPLIVVAGYAGGHNEWRLFERSWRKKLIDHNIEFFHAKDSKCDILRPYLVDNILKRKLYGVICAISPDEYNLHATPHFKSTIGNAYAACIYSCTLQLAQIARDNELGKISIVIESGQPNSEYVEKTLKLFMKSPRYDIASVTIGDKKDFVPLQTADFLSHIFDIGNNKNKYYLGQLISSGNLFRVVIPPGGIEKTAKNIKAAYDRNRYLKRKSKKKRKQIEGNKDKCLDQDSSRDKCG